MSKKTSADHQPGDLAHLIREKIAENGPITFARFMSLALYHQELGYYAGRGEKLGPRGDFYTSPETHPAFGSLIGRQLVQMWSVLNSPDEFTVVEVGAGSGALCGQIIRAVLHEELYRHLRYVIVEASSALIERQQEHLADRGLAKRVAWFEPTASALLPAGVVGCFLSNELLDAFPVHRVVMQEGQLREVYVGVDGDRFVEVIGDLSTPALEGYFSDLGLALAEGARAEINLDALSWIHCAGESLARGFVLTIDYGFSAEELFSSQRREGTLMCYYRHTLSVNPYIHVGEQDLTTHVDFSSLIRAGRAVGLRFVGLIGQAEFLANLGIEAYLTGLDTLGLSSAAYYDNKFAMRRLANPEGLGKFKVLIQRKSISDVELDCLNPCNDSKRAMIVGDRRFEIPLLDPSAT